MKADKKGYDESVYLLREHMRQERKYMKQKKGGFAKKVDKKVVKEVVKLLLGYMEKRKGK